MDRLRKLDANYGDAGPAPSKDRVFEIRLNKHSGLTFDGIPAISPTGHRFNDASMRALDIVRTVLTKDRALAERVFKAARGTE